MRTERNVRGYTLVELLVVVAIMGFVVTGISRAIIDMGSADKARRLTAQLQGEGRDGLRWMERDIRNASMGSSLGVVTSEGVAGIAQSPTVQIFDNVAATAEWLPIKVGTDALLLIGAASEPVAATVGNHSDPGALAITDVTGFANGDTVLVGSYRVGSWDVIAQDPVAGQLMLSSKTNLYPNGKLVAGSSVRLVRARLYFVNAKDELVRAELTVPRAPVDATQVRSQEVLAKGIENLQADCQTDDGVNWGGCDGLDAGTNPDSLLGTTSRIDPSNAFKVRTVDVEIVVRSLKPQRRPPNDEKDLKILIGNQGALPVGGAEQDDPDAFYIRRAYRLSNAVRNTSLGAL